MEMRYKVPSIVGAQDLETSSYQVWDLEDIEFNCEKDELDLDAVFRPGIDSPLFFNYIWRFIDGGIISWKPHYVDEEEDKENDLPSTPASVRSTKPPRLQRCRAFGAGIETLPDYVFRNLFQ